MHGWFEAHLCIYICVFFYFNKGFRIFVDFFVFVFYYSEVSQIWLYVEIFIELVWPMLFSLCNYKLLESLQFFLMLDETFSVKQLYSVVQLVA